MIDVRGAIGHVVYAEVKHRHGVVAKTSTRSKRRAYQTFNNKKLSFNNQRMQNHLVFDALKKQGCSLNKYLTISVIN